MTMVAIQSFSLPPSSPNLPIGDCEKEPKLVNTSIKASHRLYEDMKDVCLEYQENRRANV